MESNLSDMHKSLIFCGIFDTLSVAILAKLNLPWWVIGLTAAVNSIATAVQLHSIWKN